AGHLPAATATAPRSRVPNPATSLPSRVPELPQPPPAGSAVDPTRTPLHIAAPPPDDGPDTQPARPLRAPYLPLLPPTLDILRALRPLNRRRPAAHASEIDEEATVTWYAERRRWLPVLRPAPARALDVALVLDATTRSMAAWSGLGEELQALLARLGAFQN